MENVCHLAVGFIHNKSGLNELTMKLEVICLICHYPDFFIIQHTLIDPVNPDMSGITVVKILVFLFPLHHC